MSTEKLTRRRFLRGAAMAAASVALAACAQPTPEVVEKIVKETVVVEKEKVVEKPVEKVVEKVITATVAPTATKKPLTAEEKWRAETMIIPGDGGAAPNLMNALVPGVSGVGLLYGLAWEHLWMINFETGEITPWLAAATIKDLKWNAEFTQCDVPLRKGVEWSDGKPFTAHDLAFTLNMLRDNPALRFGAYVKTEMKNAEAIDDYTCRVTLNNPNPRFFHHNFTARICSGIFPLPKHIMETVSDPVKFEFYDPAKGWPVWTGPYKVVKTSTTDRIFERRDDWWGAKTGFRKLPAPKRVAYIQVQTREKGAAMMENNELDYYGGLEFSTFVVLKQKRPDIVTFDPNPPYEWMDPCPWNLGFNCSREPWNDRDIRWAVAYGIDQVRLAKIVHGGFGIPAKNTYPPYPVLKPYLDAIKDLEEKYDCTVFDQAKAKQIIESKGWKMGADGIYEKDGKKFTASFIATPAAITTAQATMISAMLREIGIDAQPKFMTSAAYWDLKNAGNFDLECSWTVCGSVDEPYAEMDQFHSKWVLPEGKARSGNQWSYVNPEFDKLVDEMKMIPPGDKRLFDSFHRTMEVWLRDLPVCPLDQSARILAFNTKYWKNWPQLPNNNYVQPPPWWMQFEEVLCNIQPAA